MTEAAKSKDEWKVYGTAGGAFVRAVIPGALNGAYHGVVDGLEVDALKHAGLQYVASGVGQALATLIPVPDSFAKDAEMKKAAETELMREAIGSAMTGVLYAGGEWGMGSKHLVKSFLVGAIIDAATIPLWMWSFEVKKELAVPAAADE